MRGEQRSLLHTRPFTWAALRRTKLPALPQEAIESHTLTIRGLHVFYRLVPSSASEDAPAIILIHGLLVSGRYFLRLAQRLSRFYRVYIVDLPGFGKSRDPGIVLDIAESAEIVYAWMQAMNLEQAILIGQSMGAQVVTQCIANHPEVASRLVLISPTMDPRTRWFPRLFAGWLWNMLREAPILYPLLVADFVDCGIPRFVRMLRYALHDHIEDRLALLSIPTLVIAGAGDTLSPVSWSNRVARLLPHATLLVITGHIHDVHFTAPVETAQAIHAFLTSSPALSEPVPDEYLLQREL